MSAAGSCFVIYPDRDYLTLFGTYASGRNVIGRCRNHRRFITAGQLRRKKCLRKQCRHLARFENHPYWISRAKRRMRKNGEKR